MNALKFKGKILDSKEVKELYHVGSMDIADKHQFSLDGNGLSVSTCPHSWINLAQISSNTIWRLYKKDIQMLDYYSLTENELEVSNHWGIEEGYLTKCRFFKTIKFDTEINDEVELIYDSFEEACSESYLDEKYDSYEEYVNYQEYESSRIEELILYFPTDKFKKISMVHVDETNAQWINLLIFLEKNTDLDGIYWNDILNESEHILPKGIIFNSKINNFSREEVYWCEDCNKYQAEYEINGEKLCIECTNERYGLDEFNPETEHYTCSKCGNEYFFGFGKCDCYKML